MLRTFMFLPIPLSISDTIFFFPSDYPIELFTEPAPYHLKAKGNPAGLQRGIQTVSSAGRWHLTAGYRTFATELHPFTKCYLK